MNNEQIIEWLQENLISLRETASKDKLYEMEYISSTGNAVVTGISLSDCVILANVKESCKTENNK